MNGSLYTSLIELLPWKVLLNAPFRLFPGRPNYMWATRLENELQGPEMLALLVDPQALSASLSGLKDSPSRLSLSFLLLQQGLLGVGTSTHVAKWLTN